MTRPLSVALIGSRGVPNRYGGYETLFDELKADYQQQAVEKRIDLQLKLPPKMPVIRGDRDKITLALHNLVGNALKYTPAGGRVAVNVSSAPRMKSAMSPTSCTPETAACWNCTSVARANAW